MTRVDQLIKEALLSKDKIALNAYKNLKSELQKVLTAKNAPEYSEALFTQIIAKYAKSLEDAILQFSEAHRDDLVSSYTDELEVVKKLLPEPVNEAQICFELANWMIEHGYNFHKKSTSVLKDNKISKINFEEFDPIPKKEMGTAIKYLKSKFPTTDGKMISEIVKKYLI